MKENINKSTVYDYFKDDFNETIIYKYFYNIEKEKNKENKQQELLRIRKITMIQYKDVLMSFLLHLN